MSKIKDHLEDLTALHTNALHGRIVTLGCELVAYIMNNPDENLRDAEAWCKQERAEIVTTLIDLPDCIKHEVMERYFDHPKGMDATMDQAVWYEVGQCVQQVCETYSLSIHPDSATLLDMLLEEPADSIL
jgi:hypothetical protein